MGKSISELHEQAMLVYEAALIAKRNGNDTLCGELLNRAFVIESSAADALEFRVEYEPTRSILYLSAANIAIMCGNENVGKSYASKGLTGNPQGYIMTELNNIISDSHNEE